MIRFICFLLGKKYESCKSCETLKQQLEFERDEKKRLTDTLISIISPRAVESVPIELNPIAQSSALFSKRRAAAEAKDREEARILKLSANLGKPDFVTDNVTTERLERELGIDSEKEEKTN